MLTCQDLNLADWRSKEVREVKISTRFIIEKGEKNSEVKEEISMKESIYGDAEESREESLLLEDQKKNMTSRNSELTGDIDKLQAEIDKAMHKLKFSKDIDIMVSEAIGKYGIMHLVVMFFIGVLFGYYMLG